MDDHYQTSTGVIYTFLNIQGTCFTLDASLYSTTSPYMYKYERNLAMLLALTLPISSTNPMFVTKYMNYEACR